ncbi:MAG: copper-binding protein [Comamonas sp.]|nr:copper-binding protein [Comamonas sp.]
MNALKQFLTVSALALGVALPVSGLAQASVPVADVQTAASAALTDGEIKKVDAERGKVTIKHGVIQNLDMPGMTMVFTAKDKGMLSDLKPGDKVKFVAADEGGKLVVTEIHAVQ